jgi:hypothetical protein
MHSLHGNSAPLRLETYGREWLICLPSASAWCIPSVSWLHQTKVINNPAQLADIASCHSDIGFSCSAVLLFTVARTLSSLACAAPCRTWVPKNKWGCLPKQRFFSSLPGLSCSLDWPCLACSSGGKFSNEWISGFIFSAPRDWIDTRTWVGGLTSITYTWHHPLIMTFSLRLLLLDISILFSSSFLENKRNKTVFISVLIWVNSFLFISVWLGLSKTNRLTAWLDPFRIG